MKNIKKIVLIMLLITTNISAAYAASYTTTVTSYRSWGGNSLLFQTAAYNACGINWWIIPDLTVDRGYASVLAIAFATGKQISINEAGCDSTHTNYMRFNDFRILQ